MADVADPNARYHAGGYIRPNLDGPGLTATLHVGEVVMTAEDVRRLGSKHLRPPTPDA